MPSLIRHDFTAPDRPDERWEAWRSHVEPAFDLAPKPETDLTTPPAMTTLLVGNMILGDIAAPAQIQERSLRRTALQGVDHLLLRFYTKGRSRVEANGLTRQVGANDVLVHDFGQPILVDSDSPVESISVLFPRTLLGDRLGALDALHGTVFGYRTDPVAQMLFSYLAGIIANGNALAPHQVQPMAEAAAKLCTACLPATGAAERTGDLAASIEVRGFIQSALGDPGLDVESLAARFAMSRASLYRLFSEEGGVQAYIRERRLMKAMRLLSQPVEGVRPRISSVAYACGFADAKTFSRAFTTRFGILPKDARAGESETATGERADDVLHGWINRLAA
ncbi:hypothetical protein ASG43_19280 [Aureimonas sp. Leaf454]|uniref:helix-turn-helix domain-containing protein n=1 Tax=Aureimonas sp. Leaf454 TaxID=1736381 RepID=UPI0007158B17|nr:helix-turn-helix domain-containing protein [Aureimonas sp. Leaf454]KQT53125.1 hypothetical protein ASG43_19280 [Aureimonas sp. Leaf454]